LIMIQFGRLQFQKVLYYNLLCIVTLSVLRLP